MAKGPRLKSETFWNMSALAVAGRLASCESCVEFYYLQSKANAAVFLDSCAGAGLVDRWSLLELRSDLEPISSAPPTLRQQWFNQAIYLSSPPYRKYDLDMARERTEGTKNAVYNAFKLYHEELKTKDAAIVAAYDAAIKEEQLRFSSTAKDRADVALSVVAMVRLILDGFKVAAKKEAKGSGVKLSNAQVEQRATEMTIEYVKRFWDAQPTSFRGKQDHGEELETFINEFLSDYRGLNQYWEELDPKPAHKMPSKSHVQILKVIGELIRTRYHVIMDNGDVNRAELFLNDARSSLKETQAREQADPAYVNAISEVIYDLDRIAYEPNSPLPVIPTIPEPIRPGLR